MPPPAALAQDPPAQPLEPIQVPMIPGSLLRLRDAASPLQVQVIAKLSMYPRDTQTHSENTDTATAVATQMATDKALPSTAPTYRTQI